MAAGENELMNKQQKRSLDFWSFARAFFFLVAVEVVGSVVYSPVLVLFAAAEPHVFQTGIDLPAPRVFVTYHHQLDGGAWTSLEFPARKTRFIDKAPVDIYLRTCFGGSFLAPDMGYSTPK
ncbi:hypothetical protein SODALDRAFT_357618 [Sodiomyces alkalinus F11]|uniref:Uncharacterized protein n=1 Tax=Sodiomyces alkalinus (strain CBS 110278 / VKM F-3762 / F11) TaxID=1314773 RepID=A0A3N2Q485_SODAK|nr:hypothetical protein SODALDRAFT_357618 [Sodiomyces alkalinus F11]ROT41562.1 hypothetical protein SODALDRAFT_357618 [Sodiomyces alkalinus F11]